MSDQEPLVGEVVEAAAADSEQTYRTKSGRVLTDEDIERLADEAERGYDVSNLEQKGELATRPAPATTLFGTDDPVDVVERATRVAQALADVIEKRGLFKMISGRKHVYVEGWTLLGSMLGVYPITEWTRQVKDSKGKDGWEARVIAQTKDGNVVGTREAMCSRGESKWANRDDHALRSMAQTRAVSGALASPLRFVMELAGYAGTPEAEMPQGGDDARVDHADPPRPPQSFTEAFSRLVTVSGHPEVDWAEWWLPQLIEALFPGKTATRELNRDERNLLGQRLGTVVLAMEELATGTDFPPFGRVEIRSQFAKVTEGVELEGPPWRIDKNETERPTQAELEAELAGEAPPDDDVEGIPFGEESQEAQE